MFQRYQYELAELNKDPTTTLPLVKLIFQLHSGVTSAYAINSFSIYNDLYITIKAKLWWC